jgi:hypothetical protein
MFFGFNPCKLVWAIWLVCKEFLCLGFSTLEQQQQQQQQHAEVPLHGHGTCKF